MLHISRVHSQSSLRRAAASSLHAMRNRNHFLTKKIIQHQYKPNVSIKLCTAFAVCGVATIGYMNHNTAQCEALYAQESFKVEQAIRSQISKSKQGQQDLLKQLQKQLSYYWLLLTRWWYLMFAYGPAIVCSPMLLMGDEKTSQDWWELFKKCILASGPCSIKFAQWISTRPDLFPKEICMQFQHLQSNKTVPSWDSIIPVLRKDYGEHWESLLNLEYEPNSQSPIVVGGGCVAQVVKGHVKVFSNPQDPHSAPIEKEVAIKITHPGVKQSIIADIELMRTLSSTLEYWIPSAKQVSLSDSVEEFAKIMIEQVDMTFEAEALATFRRNFSNMDSSTKFMNMILRQKAGYDVVFPEPIFEYTTEDVLVESYEEGVLIRDYIKVCPDKEKKLIAKIGLDAIFKMIFLDNFIHADLHPGNIIFCTPGLNEGMKLSFIDAGLVVSLQPSDRRNLIDLFKAVIKDDGYAVGKLMVERSRSTATVLDPEGFATSMKDIVKDVHKSGLTLGRIGVSDLLQKVLILCYKHQVKLESRFASVIVAMGVVEGLGRQLDPNIDILQKAAPFVMQASIMTSK